MAIGNEPVVRASAAAEHRATPYPLAERELKVLRLLAAGHSNRELSDALGISPTTAARHISNIFIKLGVDSRAKATAYAYQRGII